MGRGTETCAECVAGCPSTMACSSNEEPEHPASVGTFALDKYEVTVGRFRAFVNAGADPPSAGAGAHPLITGSGWDSTWNAAYPADAAALVADLQSGADCSWVATGSVTETFPINCVTWYEAFAFCVWDSGRLPTEAEWEYVAAGGDENRFYPWGAIEPTAAYANYGVPSSSIAAVGSALLGVGRWGHLDLAGNVYEWTLDGYGADYYSVVATGCDDCANLGVTSQRSIRGGGWTSSEFGLRPAHRDGFSADLTSTLTGFRCARDP
jgi:sulfatase modifying factor 1